MAVYRRQQLYCIVKNFPKAMSAFGSPDGNNTYARSATSSGSSPTPARAADIGMPLKAGREQQQDEFGMDIEAKQGTWERVDSRVGLPPCQRSLHASAVWNNSMFVFGGYDGQQRVNDLHSFDFGTNSWNLVSNSQDMSAPSPRDRHIAVVWASG